MLSAEEILEEAYVTIRANQSDKHDAVDPVLLRAMRIYRNQGIEQAAKVCCIHMTDGFSICSESAVLALKE